MAQPLGKICGSVALPALVIAESAKLADEVFSAAEEQAFCGDEVETSSIPAWALRDGAAWLPDEVAKMAKELKAARRLIATFGSMLIGCREQSFAGWQNGNGTNVGDKIDAARRAYDKV
ncbi:hypothetical protein [Burkholderia gladioli]|uniref:hypothetical protein n=1 Tax=Burkholderia gladioli TaxID=28095 RepID=UPI00163EEA8A|nr:hypothetical protein [Burkholderia gladioli]